VADDLFIIDANVLLEAANTYYTFDRVPGYWEWLASSIRSGRVRSVSLVADEIVFPDELVDWVDELAKDGLFLDVSDSEIQTSFAEVADWVVRNPFGPEHIAKFLDGADPWIIAAGRVLGATVVTQESPLGPGTKKVKIPNVSDQFGVPWINTFTMLNRLDAKF
jgi:hypothetical protein